MIDSNYNITDGNRSQAPMLARFQRLSAFTLTRVAWAFKRAKIG